MLRKGLNNETYISAKQTETSKNARISETNVHKGGQKSDQPETGKGKKTLGPLACIELAEAHSPKFTFKKADRILKRSEYLALSAGGKKSHNKYFVAAFCPGQHGRSRLGITVTKKVGHAATRNRIKRLTREHFRLFKDKLEINRDINIIAKKGVANISNEEIFSALKDIFDKMANSN